MIESPSMRAVATFICLSLAACTQFPELEGTVAPDLQQAKFPKLVPLNPLLANAAPIVGDPVQATDSLSARIDALRARANRLQRQSVIDSETRARIEARHQNPLR